MRRGHLPVRTSAHTATEVLCVKLLTAFRHESICALISALEPPKSPPFCTFFWRSSDVPGNPPIPLSTGLASGSNNPMRHFLYRQEVVTASCCLLVIKAPCANKPSASLPPRFSPCRLAAAGSRSPAIRGAPTARPARATSFPPPLDRALPHVVRGSSSSASAY